jgi:hypothetical protein
MDASQRKASAVTLGRRIDSLYERFESAWQSGANPRLDDYLAEVVEALRVKALDELLESTLLACEFALSIPHFCHQRLGQEFVCFRPPLRLASQKRLVYIRSDCRFTIGQFASREGTLILANRR